MKRLGNLPAALAITLVLVACNRTNGESPDARAKMAQQVAGLDNRVSSLETKVSVLDASQKDSSKDIYALKLAKDTYESAYFDPITTTGYSVVDVGVVRVLVTIDDIKPYADGSRVALLIGNPNSVVLNGLRGSATYGASYSGPDGFAVKHRVSAVQIADSVLPGRWNKVSITLDGVPPEKLGHLELKLVADQVRLIR